MLLLIFKTKIDVWHEKITVLIVIITVKVRKNNSFFKKAVLQELYDYDVKVEGMGGATQCVYISALKQKGESTFVLLST